MNDREKLFQLLDEYSKLVNEYILIYNNFKIHKEKINEMKFLIKQRKKYKKKLTEKFI